MLAPKKHHSQKKNDGCNQAHTISPCYSLAVSEFFTADLRPRRTAASFSDKEGEIFNLSEEEWEKALATQEDPLGLSDAQHFAAKSDTAAIRREGPRVTIVDPDAAEDVDSAAVPPIKLFVLLENNHAPIDIETLTVIGKRGIFSLDITDRLKPFLRKAAMNEKAEYVIEGEIPALRPGKYLVVLSLADTQGNYKDKPIYLKVARN